MLNDMDRRSLSQMATDIGRELRLSDEDYGKLERGFGLGAVLFCGCQKWV